MCRIVCIQWCDLFTMHHTIPPFPLQYNTYNIYTLHNLEESYYPIYSLLSRECIRKYGPRDSISWYTPCPSREKDSQCFSNEIPSNAAPVICRHWKTIWWLQIADQPFLYLYLYLCLYMCLYICLYMCLYMCLYIGLYVFLYLYKIEYCSNVHQLWWRNDGSRWLISPIRQLFYQNYLASLSQSHYQCLHVTMWGQW